MLFQCQIGEIEDFYDNGGLSSRAAPPNPLHSAYVCKCNGSSAMVVHCIEMTIDYLWNWISNLCCTTLGDF